MYQMRQILWILTFIFNLSLLQAQQSETILVGEILNKSGAERMLTQKIAKAYIALYLGTDIKESKQELDDAVKLFENRLIELKSLKITPRYSNKAERVSNLWQSYKALVLNRPTKENLLLLLKEHNTILESCEQLTREVEHYASRFSSNNGLYKMNENIVHLENIAGRQRMLTERVLLYFLANHAFIGEHSKFDKELHITLKEYQENLATLIGATENTPEIDYRLILLMKEWEQLSALCTQKEKRFSDIEKVLSIGKNILKSMEEITKNYEVLIDLRVASLLLNNAIDLASQQDILTQKITKTYLLEGITQNNKYFHERQKDIDRFEQNMDELKLFAPMEEITEALNVVDLLWTDYRNKALQASTKDGAKQLLNANSELLRTCDNVIRLLELYAKIYKKSVHAYNFNKTDWIKQIDHQEMLTERILMYSYALSWGVQKEDITTKLEQAGYEYINNFNKLSHEISIPDIQKRGEHLVETWEEIKTYLDDPTQHQKELQAWSVGLSNELKLLTNLYREKITRMVVDEAIEKANQQAMLSQKMASDYLTISMGLNKQYQQQQLNKDKLLFQKQLEALKSFAQTTSLKAALSEVNNSWNKYHVLFGRQLTKDDVPTLLEISQEMLAACELVIKEIKNSSNTLQINRINTAGHLRTKTEQILLFCLAERWTNKSYTKELNLIFVEYDKLLKFFNGNHNFPFSLDTIERYYKRVKEYSLALDEVDLYALLRVHNVLLLETEKLNKASSETTLF